MHLQLRISLSPSADGAHVEVTHFSAPPACVVNTSGAGDCLVAGALWGLTQGQDPAAALAHGMVCSSLLLDLPIACMHGSHSCKVVSTFADTCEVG